MKVILFWLVLLIVLALVPVLILKKKRSALLSAKQDFVPVDNNLEQPVLPQENQSPDDQPQDDLPQIDQIQDSVGSEILDRIAQKFTKAFLEERAFLDPNMTMEEMASRIGTNRTYISRVVNMKYGMSFRDYLNKLRIDYAKNLLLKEPNSSMVSISGRCGFYGANQFIRKFREMEGVTPTVWRASRGMRSDHLK